MRQLQQNASSGHAPSASAHSVRCAAVLKCTCFSILNNRPLADYERAGTIAEVSRETSSSIAAMASTDVESCDGAKPRSWLSRHSTAQRIHRTAQFIFALFRSTAYEDARRPEPCKRDVMRIRRHSATHKARLFESRTSGGLYRAGESFFPEHDVPACELLALEPYNRVPLDTGSATNLLSRFAESITASYIGPVMRQPGGTSSTSIHFQWRSSSGSKVRRILPQPRAEASISMRVVILIQSPWFHPYSY